jgi:hypothetical protein
MKSKKFLIALLLLSAAAAAPAAPVAAADRGREITIFLDREGKLAPVTALLPWTEHTEEKIKFALELLILGDGNYTRTLPKNTKVKRVFIDAAKVIYLDFSKDLVKDHPGGVWTETLTVTSICKTLFANFEAHSIRILADGKELNTLAGHIDLNAPITREKVELWLGEGAI